MREITPAKTRAACLKEMRRIAAGGDPCAFERINAVHDAVQELGWLDRDPEEYFDTQDASGWGDYDRDQVLLALALCVTLLAQQHSRRRHSK